MFGNIQLLPNSEVLLFLAIFGCYRTVKLCYFWQYSVVTEQWSFVILAIFSCYRTVKFCYFWHYSVVTEQWSSFIFGNIQLLLNIEVLASPFPRTDCQSPSRVHSNCASRVLIPIVCSACPTWHLPSVLCRLNVVQSEPKCTMAQSINHQRLSVEVRDRFHVSPHTICGGQSGTDTGFLRLLPMSGSFHQCSIPIHLSPTAHNFSNCHRH
jgi:hypothetical protein